MAPKKTATAAAEMPGTRKLDMTHQEILEMQQGLISLAACKSRNHEAVLILARAVSGTQKALKPFEETKAAWIKAMPKQPAPLRPDCSPEERAAHELLTEEFKTASQTTHDKFGVLLQETVQITLPPMLTGSMLQHFQEHPNPLDLVKLDPYMLQL